MIGLKRTFDEVVKPRLPRKVGVYNGVAVRDVPVTQQEDHWPNHKAALCDAIRRNVSEGDLVVVIGAGRGVAPTIASRQVGSAVWAFDPAKEMCELARETAMLNQVCVIVNQASVGPVYDAYGDVTEARTFDASEIHADVAILDCEGAEREILPDLDVETAIVETHPRFGAETSDVLECVDGGEIVGEDTIDGEVVVA